MSQCSLCLSVPRNSQTTHPSDLKFGGCRPNATSVCSANCHAVRAKEKPNISTKQLFHCLCRYTRFPLTEHWSIATLSHATLLTRCAKDARQAGRREACTPEARSFRLANDAARSTRHRDTDTDNAQSSHHIYRHGAFAWQMTLHLESVGFSQTTSEVLAAVKTHNTATSRALH